MDLSDMTVVSIDDVLALPMHRRSLRKNQFTFFLELKYELYEVTLFHSCKFIHL